MIQDIDDFHKTPIGYGTFAFVELLFAYIIGSRAIDTGSLWQYGLAILLLVGGVSNIVTLIRKHTEFVHKPHHAHKRPHKKA